VSKGIEKYRKAKELALDGQEVDGTDVYDAESGKVRTEWLSRCREERALTKMYSHYCSKLMKPPST